MKSCPACSSTRVYEVEYEDPIRVFECLDCLAIFSEVKYPEKKIVYHYETGDLIANSDIGDR